MTPIKFCWEIVVLVLQCICPLPHPSSSTIDDCYEKSLCHLPLIMVIANTITAFAENFHVLLLSRLILGFQLVASGQQQLP